MRKDFLKGIGGGLMPGDVLILPSREELIYAGRYDIKNLSREVTINCFTKEPSQQEYSRRKMPEKVLIDGKECVLRYQQISR